VDADVLVVGAGLSGLVAARTVQAAGLTVIVLDKGRSVGGRLATRRIAGGMADHGAQFFTARTPEFQAEIDAWMREGLVMIWGYGWSDGSLKRTAGDGNPRYVVQGGMNELAKRLAADLETVHTNMRVIEIDRIDAGWRVVAEGETVFTARALLMTPPVPQTIELLHEVPLHEDDVAALDRIQYGPCLAGIHAIEGDIDLPEPGALQDFQREIYWIADNQRKGISSVRIITTHAGARWSRQHYDEPDKETLEALRATFEPFLSPGARIIEEQLKKWRYSVPLVTHPRDTLVARGLPLAFAGDAFGGRGRVEGAYISGMAAGEALIDLLDV